MNGQYVKESGEVHRQYDDCGHAGSTLNWVRKQAKMFQSLNTLSYPEPQISLVPDESILNRMCQNLKVNDSPAGFTCPHTAAEGEKSDLLYL